MAVHCWPLFSSEISLLHHSLMRQATHLCCTELAQDYADFDRVVLACFPRNSVMTAHNPELRITPPGTAMSSQGPPLVAPGPSCCCGPKATLLRGTNPKHSTAIRPHAASPCHRILPTAPPTSNGDSRSDSSLLLPTTHASPRG